MEKQNLIDVFSDFKEFKNIDRETMMRILEDVFKHILLRKYGTVDNIETIVNIDRGDLEIWRSRAIVADADLTDNSTQIAYSEAVKIEPDFEVGEDVTEEIKMVDFGRREILGIRQNLALKITEYEKDTIYKKYKDRIGDLIFGEVHQAWKREILVHDSEDIELVLPKSEQIPGDNYRKGDNIKAIILRVELKNGSPLITLSRTDGAFLERLMEQEVPEIEDGLIIIKDVVRAPGERAKIAVESHDDRIDPVGACVGVKGSRINGIVRELRNESIDVVNYTTNATLYITRALNPAKITSINLDEENKRAEVYMKPDQVSLAIGKGGFNIKLAGKLTGYEVDVYRDIDIDGEDVDIEEFSDEIDTWIIDKLKSIGCDTAKSVLAVEDKELANRADFEDEMVVEIKRILRSEFE